MDRLVTPHNSRFMGLWNQDRDSSLVQTTRRQFSQNEPNLTTMHGTKKIQFKRYYLIKLRSFLNLTVNINSVEVGHAK